MLWHITIENSRIPKIIGNILKIEFDGITIYPFIFLKYSKKKGPIYHHELIHIEQIKETYIIGFYPIYFLNFFYNLYKYKKIKEAYLAIWFEREAYCNMNNQDYLDTREKYAWKKYIYD